MKLTITGILTGCMAALLLTACGGFTSDQTLDVEMYGISKTPAGATGDRDPKFQNYQLLKVDLISEDGSSTSTLFDNEEEKIFRIVDREQLIFSKTIDDLQGQTFSSLQLTFSPTVSGGESSDQELSFTMANPILTLSQAFTVEKSKSLTLLVKIDWGNTVSDEAMSEPAYTLTLD